MLKIEEPDIVNEIVHSVVGEHIYDENVDNILYTTVYTTGWVDGGKYDYKTTVFQDQKTKKFYSIKAMRSGSYYSDYHYEYPSECIEVFRKEKVITQVYYE